MSAITEQDLELLETYLDGELPSDERDALVARLENEASLSASLEALRAERFIRAQAFESHEPDERTAQQFAWSTLGKLKVGQSTDRYRLPRVVRALSTVAASIVLGFFIGWATRGFGTGLNASGGPVVAANQVSAGVRVPLTDAEGRSIVLQDFQTPESARELARRSDSGISVKVVMLDVLDKNGVVKEHWPGLVVTQVAPNSPAASAGLQKGDIIVAVNGAPIRDGVTFIDNVSKQHGPIEMKVVRNKRLQSLTMNLAD